MCCAASCAAPCAMRSCSARSEPLMWRLVPTLVREMGAAYPELVRAEPLITETLKLEETRFRRTLERGLALLDEASARLVTAGDVLAGDIAFTLYDTYGFPLDLTQDALRPRGIGVDTDGFNAAMERQQAEGARGLGGLRRGGDRGGLVRAPRQGSAPPSSSATTPRRPKASCWRIVTDGAEVDEPAGRRERRDRRQPDAVLWRVRRPGRRHRHDRPAHGRRCRASPTPRSRLGDLIVHHGKVEKGTLAVGDAVRARRRSRAPHARSAPTIRRRICCTRRCATCSATMSRRRARWSRPIACASTSRHPKPITAEELARIEDIANDIVVAERPGHDAADGRRRGASPPAPWRCSARSTATRCASSSMGDRRGGNAHGLFGRALRRHACAAHRRHRPRSRSSPRSAVAAGVRRIEALTGAARAGISTTATSALQAIAAR